MNRPQSNRTSPRVPSLTRARVSFSCLAALALGLFSTPARAQALTTPSMTVIPAAPSISTSKSLSVYVSFNPIAGLPTPTGLLTLTSGTYSTTVTVGNTIVIPAGALATGNDTLTVTYIPDPASSGIYTSATGTASVTITAALSQQVTVSTAPTGFSFTVDGTTYTTAQTFTWTVGSVHSVATTSPQTVSGVYGVFSYWTDNFPISHSYTVMQGESVLAANFTATYQLTINITGSGTVTPASGNFYAYDTSVSLVATPNAGYAFTGWTGAVCCAPKASSTTVDMVAPETVGATFVAITPASVTLSPAALSVASVAGQLSAPQSITVSNTGTTALAIGSIAIAGTNPSYFTQTNNCGTSLAGLSSCTVTVFFKPTSVATYTATLVLTDSASTSPQSMALTGTGTVPPPGTWTWINGSNTINPAGVTGTQYVAAPSNVPGGHAATAHWIDSSGNIWFFGGVTNAYTYGGPTSADDLWQWNVSTQQWTWYGSGPVLTYFSNNGPENDSIGPYGCANWVDAGGNLWLSGGDAYAAGSIDAYPFEDVWAFSPSSRAWTFQNGVDGGTTFDPQAVYGTLGMAAAANTPGSRSFAATWTDSSGNFWLFGGTNGYDAYYNDLWEFSPATKQWTWQGGPNTADQPGVYGALGTAAAANLPPSRYAAASWTDTSGNFWLFGGQSAAGITSYTTVGSYYNDLWEFSPTTMQWTWQGGASSVPSNALGIAGAYGTLSKPAATNYPGSRSDMATWTDSSGNFWLFGGQGFDSTGAVGELNDLWMFNASTRQWTWRGGYNTTGGPQASTGPYAYVLNTAMGQPGVYGSLGASAPGNIPGARESLIGWSDSNNNIHIFGGIGYDSNGAPGLLDDMWVYQAPALTTTAANIPTVTVTPTASSITTAQSLSVGITVSPASGSGVTATPTGTVTLSSGTYTSAATALVSGAATIVIPAGSLATATDTLTVSYTPDANSSATFTSASGTNTVTVTGATVQVTVGTSPTGLAFSVDGTAYTSPQSLTWTVGSNHTVATTSPQTTGGTQSTFTSWSDGGALSHAVTAPSSATTYTASFSTAYQLTTAVSPSGAGSVTPTTGSFYAAGSAVNLSATANSGYTFSNWTGSVAAAGSAATTITMSAPQSVTANFTAVVATAPVASLTSAITFPNTTQGQTSAAMTATLSNTGNATLNIGSIALGGTNAADFALVTSTNPCGNTLAAGASCLIAATFTPQGTSTYNATITVTDNSAIPTQTTTLTGTGQAAVATDFTVTTSYPAQTVTGGNSVQYTLTVTPSGGAFNGVISFSASGLPPGATATFAPPTLTPGSSPASSTVTITTVAQYVRNQAPAPWIPPTAVLAALLPLFLWKRRRVAIRTRLAFFALAALLGGGVSSLSGCGSSGFTLPAVAYTVTLTATSGSITHSTNVTLTVQ
jgi:hypothetical protein